MMIIQIITNLLITFGVVFMLFCAYGIGFQHGKNNNKNVDEKL